MHPNLDAIPPMTGARREHVNEFCDAFVSRLISAGHEPAVIAQTLYAIAAAFTAHALDLADS